MDEGIVQDLLSWIAEHPGWSGLVIFAIAWIESLIVIGIILPGIFMLFGIGAMIGLGTLEFYSVWIAASSGALLGDVISYWIGYRLRGHLVDFWPFSRYPAMLDRGRGFFTRHGAKSVIAGRFIGPLRPVIPATAGMLAMRPRQFLFVAIPACILWSPAYLLPGMLFGASLEVASEYAGYLSLVLVVFVVILWSGWWLIRGAYIFFVSRSARWLRKAITWTRRHPVLGRVAGPVLDPSQPELLSVSMLGLLLILMLWAFLLLLFLSPFSDQPRFIDQAVLQWTQTLRNHVTDPAMVAISQMSRWSVLLPTASAVLLWLLGAGRYNAAIHWLVAMGGGVVLQFLLGWTLRATPMLEGISSAVQWQPSPALSLTTVVLGFFTIMVAKEIRRSHRHWPYLVAGSLLILLFMARIYLGLDWLSGALVGLFLSLAWTAIVGIAYRQRALLPFAGPVASIIFYTMLGLTLQWQIRSHLDQDLAELKVELPQRELAAQDWWTTKWDSMPQELTRFSTVAARDFNFQVATELPAFREALEDAGWVEDAAADWSWVLRSLDPNPLPESLPLLGKDHLGRMEVLRMRRFVTGGGHQTLRLWASGTYLTPGDQNLYLGQVAQEALVRRVRLIHYWRSMPIDALTLGEIRDSLGGFDSRQPRERLVLVRSREEPPIQADR